MKKFLSVILCLTMIFALSACSKKENQKDETKKAEITLLPYGLQYGMDYEKAKETCKDFPAINPASSNDGFLTDNMTPEYADYEKFFNINTQEVFADTFNGDGYFLNPGYSFSFNESKELYEFYVITKIYKSESSAENLFNAYIEYYNEKAGEEAEIEEDSDFLKADWEVDDTKIEVVLEVNGNDFLVYVIQHNTKYELSE